MPSQATQVPDSGVSPAKVRNRAYSSLSPFFWKIYVLFRQSRGSQGVVPLTVKQISEAYHLSDDKSNFIVDGVEVSNVIFRREIYLFTRFYNLLSDK